MALGGRVVRIATVHWMLDRWIDLQARFVDRFVGEPCRVYASLEGIDPSRAAQFHYASFEGGSHPEKLNALASIILDEADDDDLLIFLDGDAFPVQPVRPFLDEALARHPLVAVRRDENVGEPIPHPSFCATTVGFWREIEGDWRDGYQWMTTTGVLKTDPGAELLRTLTERNIEWRALVRSNTTDLDPLCFGVYGELVYHHGSAFRSGVDKQAPLIVVDRQHLGPRPKPPPKVPAGTPLLSRARVERRLRRELARWRVRRYDAKQQAFLARRYALSEQIFKELSEGDAFVLPEALQLSE
jgi:hypothetical protein